MLSSRTVDNLLHVVLGSNGLVLELMGVKSLHQINFYQPQVRLGNVFGRVCLSGASTICYTSLHSAGLDSSAAGEAKYCPWVHSYYSGFLPKEIYLGHGCSTVGGLLSSFADV